jgi:hypothetical protein
MFHEAVETPGNHSPESLHEAYEMMIVEAVKTVGTDTAVAESGVDRSVIEELLAGESPELTLEQGAALVAADSEESADDIVYLARDALLMGMTTAVLDVESLAAGIDGEMDGREIQAKVEGRFPISLREFARLHQYISTRL